MYKDLSSVLKLVSVKVHDFVFRKKLTVIGQEITLYPLLRVRIRYRKGRSWVVVTRIVYPQDVVPYGRMTLGVMKKIAWEKLVNKRSYLELANMIEQQYSFSLSCIKRVLKKTRLGFERLVTGSLISPQAIGEWLKDEARSFAAWNLFYWQASFKQVRSFVCLF